MPTAIQLEYPLPTSVEQAFAKLASREFAQQRVTREPAMNARLEEFESGPQTCRMVVRGDLPTSWLPGNFNASASIHRVESWRREGDRFKGSLLLKAVGLPVRTEGQWLLLPAGSGSLISLTGSVTVSLPVIGPMVERLVAERITGELRAELQLLAAVLGSP